MFPVDQEKREKLTDLLFELSKSQEILATPKDRAGYFRKLEEIYYNCDKLQYKARSWGFFLQLLVLIQ